MLDNVKNYFNKLNNDESQEVKMVCIMERNIYDAEKDKPILLVREDYAKDVCKLLNKENERDRYFYQIINENCFE
jgi:hypothetical protein